MYHVLIAGRSPDELNTLTSVINWEENGLQIVGAISDCGQILPFLEENSVDILILNIPCTPGNEIGLLQKVRSFYPNIRHILTADPENFSYAQRAIPMGIDNFLLQPIDPQVLLDTLHTIIHKIWQEHSSKILPSHRDYSLRQRVFSDDAYSPLLMNQFLEQQLLNQEYTQCFAYLDSLFSNDQANMSPNVRKNHIVELVIFVTNMLWRHNINVTQLFGDSTTLFATVLGFEDMNELYIWAKDFLSTVIEALKNKTLRFSPCIAHAVAHVEKNFSQEISLKTIAYEMNINAAYLGQLFKLETGQLFSVFLNRVRIENAQKLLLNSNLPVNEVSVQCGYTNISYFYNIFKKHTGKTPTQYRKAKTK